VIYLAKPGQLYQALRAANYQLVLAALGIAVVWLAVRSMAWRVLLQEKATFSQVFFAVNEGYLLNNILPFRLGEVARSFLLSLKAGLSFWEVFSTVLIERALDLGMAAALLLISLPFVVGGVWARQAALIAAGMVVLGIAVLYLLARNRTWALNQFHRFSARWPRLQQIAGHSLEAFFTGLAVLTNGKRFLGATGLMLLDWLIALAQYYVIILAFIPEAPLLWAAFTLGIAALGVAAPSSPGSLGVYELAIVGALAVFGIDAASALALALTAHLSQYLLVGVFGSIGLARDGESLISLYSRVRGITEQKPAE
jgi:hypothetical protein